MNLSNALFITMGGPQAHGNSKPFVPNRCIVQAVCRSPSPAASEAVATDKQRIKPNYRRRVLRLDLDRSKSAVLNCLAIPNSGDSNCSIDELL
jgi:hypothetical protein